MLARVGVAAAATLTYRMAAGAALAVFARRRAGSWRHREKQQRFSATMPRTDITSDGWIFDWTSLLRTVEQSLAARGESPKARAYLFAARAYITRAIAS